MQMTIKWSNAAKKDLDEIYDYYSHQSEEVATKIYNSFIDDGDRLLQFPFMAPRELLLVTATKEYRSLVSNKHYKIIYYVKKEIIQVAAVWDCRQNIKKLWKRFKLFRH